MKQICGDCLHYYACAAWNIGSLANTEAGSCVNYTPAADVVEVVRCKDCDLWNEWDESGHEQTGNYACSCAYFSNEDGYVVYTGPDDYCSYGERKEAKE